MPHKDPEARRAYRIAYDQKNRERINAWTRARRRRNPEKKRAEDQAYRLAHPEKSRARTKRWQQRHPEQVSTAGRAYRQANAERLRAKQSAKRQANLEEMRAKDRAYRNARPKEQLNAYARTRRQRKAAKVHATERAYRLAHPEKSRLKEQLRRTRKYELPYTFRYADETFCRAYFDHACAVCGNQEGFQWTIAMDHWIPLKSSACPGTIATNMIPLCHGLGGCNNSKLHRNPDVWLIERFGPRKAAQILKKIHAYFALVSQQKAS